MRDVGEYLVALRATLVSRKKRNYSREKDSSVHTTFIFAVFLVGYVVIVS